jgi:dolichyl-phosphate beta-glucosyltransferase
VALHSEPHRGKGAAVRVGMLAAKGRLRFLCDADLSMPIEEIAKFTARVPVHADLAIGCREGLGARRIDEPQRRHSMGRVFNWLVRRLLLPRIQDTQCGFKLFTADAATAVFQHVTVDGWAFDVEALVVADRLGYRIEAVPITWQYASDSRVSPLCDAVRMTRDVLRIRVRAWRGTYRLSSR